MRVSTHGKKRMRERVQSSLTNRNVNSLFKTALHKGYTPKAFIDGDFKKYLMAHSKKNSVKVFQDHMYLYNGSRKILYTVWRVPNQFLPVEQHLKRNQPNPNQLGK